MKKNSFLSVFYFVFIVMLLSNAVMAAEQKKKEDKSKPVTKTAETKEKKDSSKTETKTTESNYKELKVGEGAIYDGVIELDLSEVESMIALPMHPSLAMPINEFKKDPKKYLKEAEERRIWRRSNKR